MEWFNVFGLAFIAVIMVPNVIYAFRHRDVADKWRCRPVEVLEQIGRFDCLGSMIFHVPGTWFGWPSDEAFAIYLIVDTALALGYCLLWIALRKKHGVGRALALSVTPSALFLFSGIMSRSVLLIVFSALFAPAHILISYKNAD